MTRKEEISYYNHKSRSSRRNDTNFGLQLPNSQNFYDDKAVTYRGPPKLFTSYVHLKNIRRFNLFQKVEYFKIQNRWNITICILEWP